MEIETGTRTGMGKRTGTKTRHAKMPFLWLKYLDIFLFQRKTWYVFLKRQLCTLRIYSLLFN